MKYIKLFAIALVLALIGTLFFQHNRINHLKAEKITYERNTNILMSDLETYQTKDSLNGARIGALELKLEEFAKFRAEDAKVISSLMHRNEDLKSVISSQTETIVDLQGKVKDSLIFVPGDTIYVETKAVKIKDPWFELEGLVLPDDTFRGTFVSRDSLLVAETVEYKRFLGFLWKTRKIKDRNFDIINKNPHTRIEGFEVISIEKDDPG